MNTDCHVEPLNKSASAEQMRNADNALLAIKGMGCENCATRVRNGLLLLDGVFGAEVFLNLALAEVHFDSKEVPPQKLLEAVARAGNDGHHEYCAELVAV